MRRFYSQKGSIIILVVLAAAVIVLLFSGVLQISKTGSNQAQLQDIADSAALAGASEMIKYIDAISSDPEFNSRTGLVQQYTQQYINANYAGTDATNTGLTQTTITVDWNALRVRVDLSGGQQALTNAAKNITDDVSATATAELVIPDIDWCFAIDVSQSFNNNPINAAFSYGAVATGVDPRIFIDRLAQWVQHMQHVPTFTQRLGYAVVPYGNAVNIGLHHMDRVAVPRADGRTHQQAYNNRSSLDVNDPQFLAHAAVCDPCSPASASVDCPSCISTPACFSGASTTCFAQYVDNFIGAAAIQDRGLSVGCVLERRPDNYFNDFADFTAAPFSPMVTFFETGCSSGHMYCVPPVLPLVRSNNPTFGQPLNTDPVEMWDVPTSGTPISFEQLPLFQQGLTWCHRVISPNWNGIWQEYTRLPDFSTFTGVNPNYGRIGDVINISADRKKIITVFANDFLDTVSPNKVKVALSKLDRTAYSEAPDLAGNLQGITRETCDFIRNQRYGARQLGVDVHIVTPGALTLSASQRDLLRECATSPHMYREVNALNPQSMRALMIDMLREATQTRLVD